MKFNANSGIGTIADQSLTCGKAQALTANSFIKIGWHFAGWATSTNGPVAYVDKQFVKNLAPGGSVTLYAVWTENQYSISGNIHSDSGSEVSVKLMRGSAQTETTQIVTMGGVGPYAGSYSFIGVPAGTYNIVATQGHKTITELIAVTDKDKTADITMPSGGVNSLLKVEGEDTHPVMVGGLKDEAQTKAETGKTVTVTMTVEKKEEQQCPETVGDAAQKTQEAIVAIKSAAPDKTLEFMDIVVEKEVKSGRNVESTETLSETNNVMEIVITYDMTGKNNITVYRCHVGQTQKFTENHTKADGTFYLDAVNSLIYVYAQKFSTYAIGYTLSTPGHPGGGSTGGSGSDSRSSTYTVTINTAASGVAKTSVTTTISGESVTKADGDKVTVTKNSDGTYAFTMSSAGVTVTPVFAKTVLNPIDTGMAAMLQTEDYTKYISGYSNGTVAPDKNMTRGEAVQTFYNLLVNKDAAKAVSFPDVPVSSRFAKAVGTLATMGIINGYSSKKFDSGAPITREQFCAIAVRFATKMSVGDTAYTVFFSDVTAGSWSYDSVMTAASMGWINGYSSGAFGVKNKITRAQVMTIVNWMLGRLADQSFVDTASGIKTFSDLSKTHWAYYDICEAINTHDHTVSAFGAETWTGLQEMTVGSKPSAAVGAVADRV